MTRNFALATELAAALRRNLSEGSRLMTHAAQRQLEQMKWLYRPQEQNKELISHD